MYLRLQRGMRTSTLYAPLNQKQFEPHMLAESKTLLQSHHSGGPLSAGRRRDGEREKGKEKKNEKEERLNLSANTMAQYRNMFGVVCFL